MLHQFGRIVAAAAILAAGQGAARAQAPALNPLTGYTGLHESFHIPYSNNPGYGTASPSASTVAISILGSTHHVTLDTGSRGLYLSENMLPGNYTPVGISGNLYLSSSKRLFEGTWANLTVSFPQATAHGGLSGPAQSTLPVLVVQTITAEGGSATFSTVPASGNAVLTNGTLVPYSNHTLTLQPGQVVAYADNPGVLETAANFGVGIDPSGTSTHPNNTNQYNQQYNAFLNLDQMKAGTMRAGYTLDQTGVHAGLTQATTGYAYTNLVPSGLAQVPGSPPDWQVPTGTIIYNGTTSQTGRILLDVGIDYSFMILPGQPSSGNVSGNYTVNLLNSDGAVSYEINGHADNLLNPEHTQWSDYEPGPFSESLSPWGEQFLNTGRNIINGFDLVYDADGGLFGVKPNSTVPHSHMVFTADFYPSPVPAPVPEPATIILPVLGLGAVVLLRRRFRA